MLKVPAPAVAGENLFPVTPVPEKVPPLVVGVRVTSPLLVQYELPDKPANVASGVDGEVNETVEEEVQLLASFTTIL